MIVSKEKISKEKKNNNAIASGLNELRASIEAERMFRTGVSVLVYGEPPFGIDCYDTFWSYLQMQQRKSAKKRHERKIFRSKSGVLRAP